MRELLRRCVGRAWLTVGRQTQWTWDRAQVSHRTSVQDDGQHDDLLAHERRYQRGERLSDRSQEFWTAEIYYLSWTSVRQRQHHHVSLGSTGRTMLNEFAGKRIEFKRVRGVLRLLADLLARLKSGNHGVKMLMGFEHESAAADEAQPARPGNVLVLPSETEVKQHELTHLPFRNWCRHCARAKSKEGPHPESSPGGVSKFATDYMFMGEDGTPITIPAGYDGLTKAFFAIVVPCNGTSLNVLSTGHQKVILQSDQEPSIIDVKH